MKKKLQELKQLYSDKQKELYALQSDYSELGEEIKELEKTIKNKTYYDLCEKITKWIGADLKNDNFFHNKIYQSKHIDVLVSLEFDIFVCKGEKPDGTKEQMLNLMKEYGLNFLHIKTDPYDWGELITSFSFSKDIPYTVETNLNQTEVES